VQRAPKLGSKYHDGLQLVVPLYHKRVHPKPFGSLSINLAVVACDNCNLNTRSLCFSDANSVSREKRLADAWGSRNVDHPTVSQNAI
jgi:hypothetical protein